MDLHIHLTQEAGRFVATTPMIPGCHGIGPDPDTAIARLQRVVSAYTERPPASPFASVRKRLDERATAQGPRFPGTAMTTSGARSRVGAPW